MVVSKSARKLRRLVLAQSVAETMAKSQVGELSAALKQQEHKLEAARDAFSKATTTLFFADLHLRHIHGLSNRCLETKNQLELAQQELQSETVRNKKLRSRLKTRLAAEQRDEEGKRLLEILDRRAIQSH